MKRFSLLALLSLVAFVLAIACTDATSPNSRLAPKSPDLGIRGEEPPPPADVAIAITITSTPVSAVFTGVFFNNGKISEDGLEALPTFDGMAWLRFDNKQPDVEGGFFASAATSANARFMVKDLETPTGSGTLYLGGVAYKITQVISFVRFASCGVSEEGTSPCAHIEFMVTDPAGVSHGGHLLAFEKSECLVTDPKIGLVYDCDLPPISD